MKILFMEKFDGSMAHVPKELGRDPRMKVSTSAFSATAHKLNSVDGLYVVEDSMPSQGSSNRIVTATLTLPARDPNKRYSLLFKGLNVFYKLWYYGASGESPTSYMLFRLAGVTMSSFYSTTVGEYPYSGNLLKMVKEEEVDIEVVQEGGKLYFYKDDTLVHMANGSIPAEILNISASSNYYYSFSGYGSARWGDVRSSPIVKLKGIVFVELDEGEKRIGSVRLDSTIVSVNDDTNLDMPDLNKNNYADENFTIVGDEGITLRPITKTPVLGEVIVHNDVRVAMTAVKSGTSVSVVVKDADVIVGETTYPSIPVGSKHTVASACNITPLVDVTSLNNLTITVGPVI